MWPLSYFSTCRKKWPMRKWIVAGNLLFLFTLSTYVLVSIKLPTTIELYIEYELNNVRQPPVRYPELSSFVVQRELLNITQSRMYFDGLRQLRQSEPTAARRVNCQAIIFDNSAKHIKEAKAFQKRNKKSRNYLAWRYPEVSLGVNNCSDYVLQRGYITVPTSQEEANFPLAFSILVYTDVDRFERLLRAIYRPNNVYCIHVDLKMSVQQMEQIRQISNCFPNVFLASKRYRVYWGHISLLYAELICMEDLLNYPDWKYLINLSGQMFPLHSNKYIVRTLQQFNGSNDIEAIS